MINIKINLFGNLLNSKLIFLFLLYKECVVNNFRDTKKIIAKYTQITILNLFSLLLRLILILSLIRPIVKTRYFYQKCM